MKSLIESIIIEGYDDSNVEYTLSKELDELFEEMIDCLENYNVEKAYELSKEI